MDYVFWAALCIPFWALLLDTLLGDPRTNWHPVVRIGHCITFFENIFYCEGDSRSLKLFYGMLTVLAVLFTVWIVGFGLLLASSYLGIWGEIVMSSLMLYICITPRSLAAAGRPIVGYLKRGLLPQARQKLSWIVGRDTEHLDEAEITRATVETISENTVDGIVAPLFWFVIGGPLGALLYRAINTMDSMLGYKNDKYLYYGRFAARLDDVANYIPARLTFLFFIISAAITGEDALRAMTTGLRDAKKHPSPNGGYAEAPVAGALHVRLGGYNSYGGITSLRAYMGDPMRPLRAVDIVRVTRMMYVASSIAVALTILFHYWLHGIVVW